MIRVLSKFLYFFNRREKLQILVLFVLILFGVLLETSVVGLVYPFISILKTPEIIYEHKVLVWVYSVIGIKSIKGFLILMAIGLIAVYLFKNIYLVLLAYIQSRFIFNKQRTFSHRFFTSYLYQPYTFYLQKNTAELLNKVNSIVPSLFNGFLIHALTFIVEIITTISILVLLILVKPLPSIITISVLGICASVFYKITRKKISELGKLNYYYREKLIWWINQGLGGLKETKILGREEFFINAFDKNNKDLVRIQMFMNVINQIPRSFFEALCITSMLIIILLIMVRNNEFQSVIPVLSMFALAAFRIMPAMNRILAATTLLRYYKCSVEVVYDDIISFDKDTDISGINKKSNNTKISIVFNEAIELKNVYYQYPNAVKPALNDISIKIPYHYSIGFVGSSGAGKTSIVDVILGLLVPTRGEVLVDGKNIRENLSSWQRKIGYIPQNIYLSDDTIQRNVAFGLDDGEINNDRVWSVLENAQLDKFIKGLPNKLDTVVGERGIRLSGGERQRIGIARALYHDPEVLVMDEGTASLDNETEQGVMQAVKNLSGKKTIIIIAHRLSTVKNCDLLYFIKDGTVTERGTYNELFEKSSAFKSMVVSANIS